MTDWRYPVAVPTFTDSYARELVERAASEPEKPQAFDTFTRYSSAGACARQMAYRYLGAPPDRLMDPAGEVVMDLGTMLHELLQDAIGRRFPDAEFEVPTRIGHLVSGHCDAVLAPLLFEYKTVGAYAFDKAIGLNRKGYRMGTPEGPKIAHVIQAGLNARALDCTTLVIGYLSKEAVSAPLAEKVGMRPLDRILAEWEIAEHVWEPLVDKELARIESAYDIVQHGVLPERIEVMDDGSHVVIDPLAQRPHWRCNGYCPFRYRCEEDGPGTVSIPVELRRAP